MNAPSEAAAVGARALAYVQAHRVVTLATAGPEGLWAAAVFYASQAFELIFLSAGHTRHARNLAARPQVAATIQEDYRDWPDIKGIQLEGRVQRLQGRVRLAAIDQYLDKYPFLAEAPAMIRQALDNVEWYRLTPSRLYFIDNSRGFGHRDEVQLPGRSVSR